MKLSISNIAWTAEQDKAVYLMMQEYGFEGLEIAPTRIFQNTPYDCLENASKWAEDIKANYGFAIPSMQSIWYGRSENIFDSAESRDALILYTKKAVDFAVRMGCGNLVFGCPRNRNIPEGKTSEKAIIFFKEISDYAAEKGTVIGMEANPSIYNTNYINDTESALKLIREVNSLGLKLNLDVGTMIYNDESIDMLHGKVNLINHVHISEPGLVPIINRAIHKKLYNLLKEEGYSKFVSIEMGKTESLDVIRNTMNYVGRLFV